VQQLITIEEVVLLLGHLVVCPGDWLRLDLRVVYLRLRFGSVLDH